MVDAAADVRDIADALDLAGFAVVGRSGGGPHALACAASLPDRVTRTAVLVGLAPANAVGLDWFTGMTDSNVAEYSVADADHALLTERIRVYADRTRFAPQTLLDTLRGEMRPADLRIVDEVPIRRALYETYAEALRAGPYGWIDDVIAFRSDWGFAVERITGHVRLWHGADDNFAPVSHSRWLAGQIRNAEIQVQAGSAHFGAVEVLPQILAWLRVATHETSVVS